MKAGKKGEVKEGRPEEKDEKATGKGDTNLYLLGGTIVVVILAIAGVAWYAMTHQEPQTINDRFQELEEEGPAAVDDDNLIYNNFVFIRYDGLWYTKVRTQSAEYEIPLHFSPPEVMDVPVTGDIMRFFRDSHQLWGGRAFITFDPAATDLSYVALANGELSMSLIKAIEIRLFAACTENITGICQTVPTVTCGTNRTVIYLKQDPETAVIVDGSCLILQGAGPGLVKAVDRVLYTIYGIMP
ncbi:hypothetical protein JXB02_02945 [Candidatus Woesearchaeota archaeon]|nr:hypothetical protein [Candidatus Woesearchaeota archaeon]